MTDRNPTNESAALSFVQGFLNKYEEDHVPFNICSLENAVSIACFAPIEQRKLLLLYLHNEAEAFSEVFCRSLLKGPVRNVIEKSCFLLSWDVQNTTYHEALLDSVSKFLDPLIGDFIKERKSIIFMIYPFEGTLSIFAKISGNVREDQINEYLNIAVKSFEENKIVDLEMQNLKREKSSDVDFDSSKFQQMMFNQLGDRDYDRFEDNEHELLKEKIAFSLFGPPASIGADKIIDGYDKKQKNTIEKVFKVIITTNDTISKWKGNVVISFIYNCTEPLPKEKLKRARKYPDYNPSTDILPMPVFVLRKCKKSENPCRVFIDSDQRVYQRWQDYIQDNELPECQMILPKDGRYSGDDEGNVLLEKHLSPACGIKQFLLKAADVTSTVVGLTSGGLFAAALIPTITVAPIALTVAAAAGIGVGLYSIVRSGASLVDRHIHRQSLSFVDSEARGAYVNIAAGSLGFVGAGANIAVSQMVSRGVNIGQGARAAVDVINAANIGASGLGILNSGYDVIDKWWKENQMPSLLTVVQLSSSILFFGNAVYNFRPANVLIDETQANTLKNIQESLKSNRQRKTFNKILKETVRQHSDPRSGRAEVISSMRNLNNRDEVIGILTRSNKLFNKKNIKFAFENGQITLNGVAVDITQFGSMSKDQSTTFMLDLPSAPPPTPESIENINSVTQTIFRVENLDTLSVFGAQLIRNGLNFSSICHQLIGMLSYRTQEEVISIVKTVMDNFCADNIDFPEIIKKISPNSGVVSVLLRVIVNFFKIAMNKYEQEYQLKKLEAQLLPNFNEKDFNAQYGVHPDRCKRAVFFFEKGVNCFIIAGSPVEASVREITEYCRNWLTAQVIEFEQKILRKDKRSANHSKETCKTCGGYYYGR